MTWSDVSVGFATQGPVEPGVAGSRVVVGVGEGRVAGRPDAGEGEDVAVGTRPAAPDLLDRAVRREELLDVPGWIAVALRDHGPRARPQEARGEVVEPRLRHGERRLGLARLGVPRRVAVVAQDHDRVRGEVHVAGEVILAVVLRVAVPVAGGGVEAHAVLGVRVGRRGVRAGEAVAVAHVDHDARPLEGRLHGGPGGVGAVDLHDVPRVPGGRRGHDVHPRPIGRRRPVRGADDEDDLRIDRDGGRGGRGRARPAERDDEQAGHDADGEAMHDMGLRNGAQMSTGSPWRRARSHSIAPSAAGDGPEGLCDRPHAVGGVRSGGVRDGWDGWDGGAPGHHRGGAGRHPSRHNGPRPRRDQGFAGRPRISSPGCGPPAPGATGWCHPARTGSAAHRVGRRRPATGRRPGDRPTRSRARRCRRTRS